MQDTSFCLFTPPPKGKKIVWEITSQCNMLCKHCCANASSRVPRNGFIFSDKKLINQNIQKMVALGIKEFYISGGEPFLAKGILSFLKSLKEKGVKVSVATNACCLNKTIIRNLSKIKIDFLHVSVDGHLPEIHNVLRGGNFFDKVVKNIRMLRRYKIPVRVGCMIWRNNENLLEEMVKLCINLRVRNLRFSWLIKVGRFKDNPQLYPKRKWLSVMDEIKRLKKKYRNKLGITTHRVPWLNSNSFQFCPGGDRLFFLNPKGQLSSCSWIAKNDPNFITGKSLKEVGFENLIKDKEILKFKKMLEERKNKGFKGCPFFAQHLNYSYYSDDKLIK